MPVVLALLVSAAFTGPSWADAPTLEQKQRFMNFCLKTKKARVCKCFYEGNAAVLNEQQMELAIANLLKDKKAQTAIKADPGFDMADYNALGQKAMILSLTCLSSN